MADYEVPLNRVGVVKATLVDLSGEETPIQMDTLQWSVNGGGGSSYFDLVVAADGLSVEIHPLATGSGSVTISVGSLGEPSVAQTRTVEIVSNSSEPPATGAYPRFIGTNIAIVRNNGALV